MTTMTLPQTRTVLEQALAESGNALRRIREILALPGDGRLEPETRVNLDRLAQCVTQFDALLAGIEDSGLDAAPEGSAVFARIQAERQTLLASIAQYAL